MVCYKLKRYIETSSTGAEYLLEYAECFGLLLLTSINAGLSFDSLQLPQTCERSDLQALTIENPFPNAMLFSINDFTVCFNTPIKLFSSQESTYCSFSGWN